MWVTLPIHTVDLDQIKVEHKETERVWLSQVESVLVKITQLPETFEYPSF